MKDGVEFVFLPIISLKSYKMFHIIDLGFIIQFILLFDAFSHIISQFAVSQPVNKPDLLTTPFSSSLSTIQFFNSSSIHGALTVLTVSFLINRDMFINNWKKQYHKFIKCNVINHIRQKQFFCIIHIKVTAKYFVLSLICYFRPSFWNFSFPGYSHYIVITTSNGYRYSFRTKLYSISKSVIITCG